MELGITLYAIGLSAAMFLAQALVRMLLCVLDDNSDDGKIDWTQHRWVSVIFAVLNVALIVPLIIPVSVVMVAAMIAATLILSLVMAFSGHGKRATDATFATLLIMSVLLFLDGSEYGVILGAATLALWIIHALYDSTAPLAVALTNDIARHALNARKALRNATQDEKPKNDDSESWHDLDDHYDTAMIEDEISAKTMSA